MIAQDNEPDLHPIKTDVSPMVLALGWRRLLRARKLLRRPGVVVLVLVAGALALEVLSIVARDRGPESHSHAGIGLLAGLVVAPALSARRTLRVPATAADAQWVLTAQEGARSILIEDALSRIVHTWLFAAAWILCLQATGNGRPIADSAVLLVTATVLSSATSALALLTYKMAAGFHRFRLGQATIWILGLMLIAGSYLRVLGLGSVADVAGPLAFGQLHLSGVVFLAAVGTISAFAWRYVLSSSHFFIEPMIQAGVRSEALESQAARNATDGFRASASWEGGRRLVGASAFLYLQGAQLRRRRTPTMVRVVMIGSLSALLSGPLHCSTWVCFAPVLGLATLNLVSKPVPQVERDEWLARAPCSTAVAVVAAQTRELIEALVLVLISAAAVALRPDFNASRDLAVAGSALLLALTLSAWRTYASLVHANWPTRAAVVRACVPVALAALVSVLWNASGQSVPTTSLGVVAASIPGLLAVVMLSAGALRT